MKVIVVFGNLCENVYNPVLVLKKVVLLLYPDDTLADWFILIADGPVAAVVSKT